MGMLVVVELPPASCAMAVEAKPNAAAIATQASRKH
jgi:hypothetical protein